MSDRPNPYIPLIDKLILAKASSLLKEMGKNRARMLDGKKAMKPHCNVLTSMARLLSTLEVCGNIELKDNRLFLATNKETRGGKFRIEVGELIIKLVQSNFKKEAKLALYRRCFAEAIKTQAKRYRDDLSSIPSFVNYIFKKKDWDTISLAEIDTLQKDLKDCLESNKNSGKTLLVIACTQVLIPLDDISNICNELATPKYKEVRCLILLAKPLFYMRYNSENGIHCEIAALHRNFSENKDFKTVAKEISDRVKVIKFTTSKYPCFFCTLILKAIQKICNNDVDFSVLGGTLIAYPGYKTPYFKESEETRALADLINKSLSDSLEQIKKGEYTQKPPFCIENSKVTAYSI